MADQCGWSCRNSTSTRARSGSAALSSWRKTAQVSGSCAAITITPIRGAKSAIGIRRGPASVPSRQTVSGKTPNPSRRQGKRTPRAAQPSAPLAQALEGEGDPSVANPRRRTRELAILNAIAGALNRSLDMGEALRETLALVGELLGLRAGWVWLLDDAGAPTLAASQALPPYLADPA